MEVRSVVSVAVQQRQRLYRDGLCQLVGAEEDLVVVGSAATADDLLRLCQDERPEVALIEADATEWDPARVTARLRRLLPALQVVGLTAGPMSPIQVAIARRAGMQALVPHVGGIAGILVAVRRMRPRTVSSFIPSAAPRSPAHPAGYSLTPRELTVLELVAAGHPSREISGKLQISHKTVENHKQRIFAKLGVQNQAHAVSVAMRTGLMRPDNVMGLARAE